MPAVKSVTEILRIAKVAQYRVHRDILEQSAFGGGSLDEQLHQKIYMERKAVEWMNQKDPYDSLLQNNANYLYMMLGKYGKIAQEIIDVIDNGVPPIITGPESVEALDGEQVQFIVHVQSDINFSVSWYKNGVPLDGIKGVSPTGENTYDIDIKFVATLADNGAHITAIATNAAGSTPSQVGILTVGAQLQGRYYYGDTDFFTDLQNGIISNIPWSGSFDVDAGQPLVVPFPANAANNKWQVIEYPDSESVKNTWFNTVNNNGQIPDQAYREIITIAQKRYIISRNAISLDSTNTTVTFS